ncbi:ABC transporter permease, partial [Rhizobium leguminosarum]|nr:ABC transporter permease [Rhizobium leguminosarum]
MNIISTITASLRRQYWLLTKRALMREWRDKTTNLARIFAACLLSCILGTLFLRLDYNQADISSRVGLTFAVLAYWSFGALTALPLTIFERPVFYMQRDQKYYCT